MGYVDGKTDADLLIEEVDVDEDNERIVVLQVSVMYCNLLFFHLEFLPA